MTNMLDWSPDFCLACDRQIGQTGNGAYCSQSCRLSDLEKASNSSASSSPQSALVSSSWAAPALPSNSSFYLPPPLNFSTLSSQQSTSVPTYSQYSSSPAAAYSYPSQTYSTSSSSQHTLYSSPSRTSLSSLQSPPTQDPATMSDTARKALQDYSGYFDQLRDHRRRRV